ncbi:MerR family transcriptional regulator [Ottowia testudinis]|uniref:MerR family transcriptional regulator n=1 Tax=Ottowia testudinis TaxID=2816950 RepID=A0A975CIN6_9BURK|nr:MerR family transcriptional regulator [Ottowia testudinis]QTD47153.1 MerR family transcriptional regulator [Ottowia testudinis]
MLTVGELAARAGLTVRTLHHYDQIGLLKPSARSHAGYRLYDRDDVVRLGAIQMLRDMGLPLAEIGTLIDGAGASLPALIARRMAWLEQEMARAQQLHERLDTLQLILAAGSEPALDDWLGSLALMGAYVRYFSAEELRQIFVRWPAMRADWQALLDAVRAAMAEGVPPDALELQPLVQRWMDLSARWMNGDLDMVGRWGRMLRDHDTPRSPNGVTRDLLEYMDQAVTVRLTALGRHLTPSDIQRLDKTLDVEWRAVADSAEQLLQTGTPAYSPAAQALARQWLALIDRVTRHDAVLRERLVTAYAQEPLLQAGSATGPEARDFLRRAAESLDPHVT